MTLGELCDRHRRIALDANVFVYLFEGEGSLARSSAAVIDAISIGRATGITASITLAEVVVGPVAAGDETMAERYVEAISSIEHFHVVPATAEIAAEAGVLRGRTKMTLADAIHVATARVAGASAFVTNDRRVRATGEVEIVCLGELTA